MADKIVVMHDGIVEQMGAPLELYDRPANLFVAAFIGSPSMNLLKGKITAGGFETEGGVVWPIGQHPADSNGRAAVFGIRPEHIQLDANGLKAEVVVVEPMGSETQVVVRCGGQNLTCVFRERITAKPGETITITPDTNVTHLFDAATGKRID